LSSMWEMLAIGYERDVSCRIWLGTNLGSKLWGRRAVSGAIFTTFLGAMSGVADRKWSFSFSCQSWFSVLSWGC
jgi:hypothetical protein